MMLLAQTYELLKHAMKKNTRGKWIMISLTILLCTLTINSLKAIETKTHFRTYYFVSHSLSPKWKYSGALGYHFEPNNHHWNRMEVRNAIDFRPNNTITIFGGARCNYVRKYKKNYQFEFRPYQGISAKWPCINHIKLVNRFMIEERFTHDFTGENNLLTQGRFRYRLDTKIPISDNTLDSQTLYLRPMFETYMSFGENIESAFISQNKYTVAPGYILSNKFTLEFRYEIIKGKSPVYHTTNKTTNLFRLQLTQKI